MPKVQLFVRDSANLHEFTLIIQRKFVQIGEN
jgi:hypothetical protein